MWKKGLFTLALIATGCGVYFALASDSDALRVRKVRVHMADHPHSSYYQEMAAALEDSFQSYVGSYLWEVSLSDLASALERVGWVKDYAVSRNLIGQVSVELDTEHMVALWARADGKLHPISDTGKVLEAMELHEAPDLPIVRSLDFDANPDNSYLLSELLFELGKAPVLNSANLRAIHFFRNKGFAVELFEPDVAIELGFPPYSTKVQRVERVVQYLQRHDLKSRVIDATFSKKVLVRARKAQYAQ